MRWDEMRWDETCHWVRWSRKRSSTHHHMKTLEQQQQIHYENCQSLRDSPHCQLSLTSYPPAPPHRNERNNLSQPTTRDYSYSVRSLHPASSCEPQLVLLDPSSFLDVLPFACCASFVSDPSTMSWRSSASFETWYALQKSLDTLVTDFWRQTSTFLSDFGRLSSKVLWRTTLTALWYRGFLYQAFRKLSLFIQTSCGRDVLITKRGFLLFPTCTFASHPTDLSTPARPDQTGSLCIAILWPTRTSACRPLAAPSSPQRRPTRPPGSSCLPSSPWAHGPRDYWSASSSCLRNPVVLVDSFHPICFTFTHYFFKSLCPNSSSLCPCSASFATS